MIGFLTQLFFLREPRGSLNFYNKYSVKNLGGFSAKVAYKSRIRRGGVVNYGDENVRILDDEIREKDPSD